MVNLLPREQSLERLQERYCSSFFVELALDPAIDGADSAEPTLQLFDSHNMKASVYELLPLHYKLQVAYYSGEGTTKKNDEVTQQLAEIFDLFESNKESLHIKFYSISMMNLEQIFINLAREQFEADEAIEAKKSLRSSQRMLSVRRQSSQVFM